MKKEMLINVSQPEECRIVIVEDGVLEELYVERASQDNYVGNIYKYYVAYKLGLSQLEEEKAIRKTLGTAQ